MTIAAGIDGCPQGWVAVVLVDGVFSAARIAATLRRLVADLPDAEAIGVDIPIGLPGDADWPRPADLLARAFIGLRRSSVFMTLPRAAWTAATVDEARLTCRRLTGHSIPAQTWALRDRVLEADEVARDDRRVCEVHPEVSFAQLAGGPLPHAKSNWSGAMLRRRLLADHGIAIPDDLGTAGAAKVDDVLDAAAAAWSATRIARGEGISMPSNPMPGVDGHMAAIWR